MKKFILVYTLFITLSLVSFISINNDSIVNLVTGKLANYSSEKSQEKIYLHTDKPYYSLDESIWFTGYLVNAVNHMKSDKSSVMNVDLIDSSDSIVDSKKIFLSKVTAAGDFKISKDWKTGKYLIRAYTNEMRNNNSTNFFQKEISVIQTIQSDTLNKDDTISKIRKEEENDTYVIPRPDLKFFPEGGYLIEGVQNKIALKIDDPIFKNQTTTGKIIDNNENEVFSFKTIKFGLGLFILIPEAGKTYTAIIDINGSEERYPLPQALPVGYQLNAINNGKNISINIVSNKPEGVKGSFLVLHQRGKLVYSKLATSSDKSYSLKLSTGNLEDGVTHLTIFDPEGNPVAERLLYIENEKNIVSVHVNRENQKIGTRQKITLSIDTKNNNGESVASVLSLAVRDMQAVPENKFSENIKTYLLLNSDLRGSIENPGYYFEKPNNSKRRYLLDLIMMTNGWRQFTWQSLLHEPPAKKSFLKEKGIYITGRTKAGKRPYIFRSTETRLTIMGGNIHQENQKSDSLGNFTYGPFVFNDSIPALIEARIYSFTSEKYKNRSVNIFLENVAQEKPKVDRKQLVQPNIDYTKQLASYLKVSKYIAEVNLEYDMRMQQLDEVVITAKRKSDLEKRNEEFNERTLHGYSDKRVATEDVIGGDSFTIYELLSRISGVTVSGTSISIRGSRNPGFYLDGMEIDSSFVESLSGSEIDFIDVLVGPEAAMYRNAGNGIISIYSKTGTNLMYKNVKRKPGIIDFQAKGYYTSRKFFAPDHIDGFEEMTKADFRTTLHWEPEISIVADKKAEVSFFSCDTKGDYIIDIQGISDTGKPFFGSSVFTVK